MLRQLGWKILGFLLSAFHIALAYENDRIGRGFNSMSPQLISKIRMKNAYSKLQFITKRVSTSIGTPFFKANTFFKLRVFELYLCSSVLTAVAGKLEDSNKKQRKRKIFGRAKTKKKSI